MNHDEDSASDATVQRFDGSDGRARRRTAWTIADTRVPATPAAQSDWAWAATGIGPTRVLLNPATTPHRAYSMLDEPLSAPIDSVGNYQENTANASAPVMLEHDPEWDMPTVRMPLAAPRLATLVATGVGLGLAAFVVTVAVAMRPVAGSEAIGAQDAPGASQPKSSIVALPPAQPNPPSLPAQPNPPSLPVPQPAPESGSYDGPAPVPSIETGPPVGQTPEGAVPQDISTLMPEEAPIEPAPPIVAAPPINIVPVIPLPPIIVNLPPGSGPTPPVVAYPDQVPAPQTSGGRGPAPGVSPPRQSYPEVIPGQAVPPAVPPPNAVPPRATPPRVTPAREMPPRIAQPPQAPLPKAAPPQPPNMPPPRGAGTPRGGNP